MKNNLRRSMFVLTMLCALGAPARSFAQDGKIRLYAGYTFFHTAGTTSADTDDGNLSGLRLSPEFRLNSFASVALDVSAEKGTLAKTDTTLTTFLGGLRLRKSLGGPAVFVHALAGGVRSSGSVKPFQGVSISVTDTGLGLDGGGGVEFNFRGSIKMRIGADYLRRKVDVGGGKTANESDLRATVGFVF